MPVLGAHGAALWAAGGFPQALYVYLYQIIGFSPYFFAAQKRLFAKDCNVPKGDAHPSSWKTGSSLSNMKKLIA